MLVPSIVGGVFISVVASGLALFLLYKLVLLQFKDKSLAFNAVLVGICFPTSFYFSLVYSEALFLFLLVSLFYLVKQKKMMLSLIPAILLPLSRPVGIFVIIPLLFSITLLKGKNFSFKIPTFNKPLRFSFNPKYFYAFAPAVGLVLYFIFIKSATGDLTSGIDQLNAFPNWDILNILNPFGMIKNFFSVGSSLHAFHESYIDRAFFIGFILILPIIYKKMGKDYFFLTLLFGMVPLFGSFISYTRYLLPLFPVWIAIAFLFNNRPALKYSVLYLFLLVQAIFLTMHVLNYWVA